MQRDHARLHERLERIPEKLRFPAHRPEPALTDDERERLQLIAEIRADGNSWERTAKQMNADVKELRQFVKKAGVAFRRIMAKTDRELTRDSRREAMFVLRKQLRSDPDSIGARLAAQCLANIDLTYYRHRNKMPKFFGIDPDSPELQEVIRVVNYVDSLNAGEVKSLSEEIIERGVRDRLKQLGIDPSKLDKPPDDPAAGESGNPVPREPKPPTKPEDHGQKPESGETTESPRASERLDVLSPRDEGPSYKPAACGGPSETDAMAKNPRMCNKEPTAGAFPPTPIRLSSPPRLQSSHPALGVRAMPRQCFYLAVLVALGLAIPATAQFPRQPRFQPVQPLQPAKPAEPTLAAVPSDAFLFVSVRVSKLWDNPAAKPLRDWYAAQKQAPFEDMIGMKADEIDRVTIFKSSWDPEEGGPAIVLISTRKPYNEATILKALGADKKAQPWRQASRRVFELEGPMRCLAFLDDRTLLAIPNNGNKSMGVNLLAQLIVRKPDGPLGAALAAATNHDIAVGIDMRGVEEFVHLIQALPEQGGRFRSSRCSRRRPGF